MNVTTVTQTLAAVQNVDGVVGLNVFSFTNKILTLR
jgi:hypothetical protein